MLEELLPSLLKPNDVIAEVEDQHSGLVHAKKEDITHCRYEAETFLLKDW